MDLAILTVSQLNQVRPFVVLTEETSSTAATQTLKDGSAVPLTTEEVGDDDKGLQRRRSKQPMKESTEGVVRTRVFRRQSSWAAIPLLFSFGKRRVCFINGF